jgi:hypothetical protein
MDPRPFTDDVSDGSIAIELLYIDPRPCMVDVRVKSREAVETYPAVPRPPMDDVRKAVEIYPNDPRPCVVDVREVWREAVLM